MNCAECGDLLVALLDCELDGEDLITVEAHLAACEACRSELDSLRRSQLAVERWATATPSELALVAQLRELRARVELLETLLAGAAGPARAPRGPLLPTGTAGPDLRLIV